MGRQTSPNNICVKTSPHGPSRFVNGYVVSESVHRRLGSIVLFTPAGDALSSGQAVITKVAAASLAYPARLSGLFRPAIRYQKLPSWKRVLTL